MLIGHIETFKPGLERHRNEYGVMNVDRGDFSARWRLEDASGVTLGECRTTGSTSMGPAVVEWGDLLQGVGENLAKFLLNE